MQKSLREALTSKGCDLIFEYKGSTISINTRDFPWEQEEAIYQKFGLKTLRWGENITLYNPEIWRTASVCELQLIKDCLAPEQPFFTVTPCFQLAGTKDLRHWDVSSAKDLGYMFCDCSSLESLCLDGWNVSWVEDMEYMFRGCKSLKKLSLYGWDVYRVKDFSCMFCGCKSLRELYPDGWCIRKDADTEEMFNDCPVDIELKKRSSVSQCLVF